MPDKGAFQQDPVDTEQTPCLEDLSGERSTQEKKKKRKTVKVQRPTGSINCRKMKE